MTKYICFVAALLLSAMIAHSAEIELAWDYPVDEEQHIDGFRLYYGEVSQASVENPVDLSTPAPYENRIDNIDPSVRTYTVDFAPGKYYFRATTYGTINGSPDDSEFSNEIDVMCGFKVPTNLTGRIIITPNSAELELAWDYPVDEEQYIDGFQLYYGEVSQDSVENPVDLSTPAPYENRIDIPAPGARTYTVDFAPGNYYFRATAYGMIGGSPDDSKFSNELNVMRGFEAPINLTGEMIITIP